MQISELSGICVLDTSDLQKMFGKFCDYIFSLRDLIFDSTLKISEENHRSTDQEQKEIEDIESEMSILNFNPNTEYRLVHKNICLCIKNALEKEKLSSFHRNTEEIIYAMVSLADEIFLNMNWKGKTFWESNMLETKFFESQIAGEEIYRKIDELLAERSPMSLTKAEIYLKTLAFGFKGKFRNQKNEVKDIDAYRNRLFHFISSENGEYLNLTKHRIFQKEYSYTIPTISRKLLPDASVITYYSAFFLFIFLVITTFVWIIETRDTNRMIYEITSIILRE